MKCLRDKINQMRKLASNEWSLIRASNLVQMSSGVRLLLVPVSICLNSGLLLLTASRDHLEKVEASLLALLLLLCHLGLETLLFSFPPAFLFVGCLCLLANWK